MNGVIMHPTLPHNLDGSEEFDQDFAPLQHFKNGRKWQTHMTSSPDPRPVLQKADFKAYLFIHVSIHPVIQVITQQTLNETVPCARHCCKNQVKYVPNLKENYYLWWWQMLEVKDQVSRPEKEYILHAVLWVSLMCTLVWKTLYKWLKSVAEENVRANS